MQRPYETNTSLPFISESMPRCIMASVRVSMEDAPSSATAHRLSTVQNADVIMVLEQVSIIERISHEKLISEKSKYYQLYTGAFELE